MAWLVVTPHVSRFILGGHKAVVRPDPIPNSAVKHSLADGSSPIGSARVGSRQFFNKNPENFLRVFASFTHLVELKKGWHELFLAADPVEEDLLSQREPPTNTLAGLRRENTPWGQS